MIEFISHVVSYITAFAPLLLVIIFGIALLLSSGWFLNNPEKWIFYAVLLFSLPAAMVGGGGGDGSVVKQLTWGMLFAVAGINLFGLSKRRFQLPSAIFPPLTLMVLIAYIILSVVWSPEHLVSAKRSIQVIGVLLIAMLTASTSLSGKGLQEQLKWPAAAFILMGLLSAAILPGLAFDADNAFKAISSHKNTWGQFSLLASLVLLFSIFQKKSSYKLIYSLLLVLSFTSLVMSKSTTSVVSFLIVLSAMFFWALMRNALMGRVFIFIGLSVVIATILGYTIIKGNLPFDATIDAFFRLADKSHNLTGRTYLWELMQSEIQRHRLIGIGFGGFWTGENGASAPLVARLNWGPPSQAHSGYLDVANELGYVGCVLFAIVLITHLKKIITLIKLTGLTENGFHAALFFTVLIINYAESSFLRTTHLWWVVFCVSIVEVHLKYRRETSMIGQSNKSLFA